MDSPLSLDEINGQNPSKEKIKNMYYLNYHESTGI